MKLNEVEDMGEMCSTKMEANIMLLEEELLKQNSKSDSEDNKSSNETIVLALAGLKQVFLLKISI